jgi:hypothetical protein
MGRGKRQAGVGALPVSVNLAFSLATHIAADAFPPRRTPLVNAAASKGVLISPHPPRVVEVAPGVCFSAPAESFGRDYDDNERDGVNDSFLLAVRGHSCISEAAWAAAEEVDDSFCFLGQMVLLANGEALLKDKLIDQEWERAVAGAAAVHQIWYVHDDGSSESALCSLAWASPEVRKGLGQLSHPTANFVADDECLNQAVGYYDRFIKAFSERRLLEPLPLGPRSRPSSLSA